MWCLDQHQEASPGNLLEVNQKLWVEGLAVSVSSQALHMFWYLLKTTGVWIFLLSPRFPRAALLEWISMSESEEVASELPFTILFLFLGKFPVDQDITVIN